MTEIICTAITGVCTIIVAIVGNVALKANKKAEERARVRAEESYLSMAMMDATLQLSVACCNALCGGHNNGNVEAAKTAAGKAKNDYDDFLHKVTSKQVGI